jgi:putative membrane protein
MRWLKRLSVVLTLLLVLIAGLLFSLQNATSVPVDLLVYQTVERPVAVWLLVAFVAGGIIGMVVGSVALVKMQASRSRLRRQLDSCEKELAQLKTLPARS